MNVNHTSSHHWPHLFLVIRLSCFFVFFGRAWQHLVWDAPFRAFFWDEQLLSPVITALSGITWELYVTSPQVDLMIQILIRTTGVLYLACAALSLCSLELIQKLGGLLLLGAASLTVLALLYCKEQFLYLGQFVEYAAQFSVPVVLYLIAVKEVEAAKLILPLKIAVALTFAGHGLYAAGYYPVPGHFVDMTISVLKVSEPMAFQFLFTAGLLDFAIALAVFCPLSWPNVRSRLATPLIFYSVFWGLATALARIFANFDSLMPLSSLNQWLPEVIYRLPHAGIPLALIICSYSVIYTDTRLKAENPLQARRRASLSA